jgi:hypothetical protein
MDITITNDLCVIGSDNLQTCFSIPANSLSASAASALQAHASGSTLVSSVIRPDFDPTTSAASFSGALPYTITHDAQGINYISSTREFLIYDGGTLETTFNTANPPTVNMQFALPSGKSYIDTKLITLYYINPSNAYRPEAVPNAVVNLAAGTVTAPITQAGVYFVGAALQVDLSGAYAYPVPFKPSAGQTTIKFDNLAVGSTIKVYTIMGELVAQLENSNNEPILRWPVTNTDGAPVASGVYIYQIKNSFSEKRGKLIIIR